MDPRTLIETASFVGVIANLILTLWMNNTVLRVKLWVSEHFVAKSELHPASWVATERRVK